MPEVILLADRYAVAHPDEDATPALSAPIDAILREKFTTDAHFTAYGTSVPHRVSAPSIGLCEIEMRLAVFDVDRPGAHQEDSTRDGWYRDIVCPWQGKEVPKISKMCTEMPGGQIYRTRGGYRIVYVLPAPVPIRTTDDATAWSRTYGAWVNYLKRRYDIVADPACKDFTRLYRAPNTRRQ